MTPRHPDWWQFVLLAAAAFRIYRLAARDTITEPLRAAATYPDDEAVTLSADHSERLEVVGDATRAKGWRIYLATLLRCPWCLGAYISAGVWLLWLAAPGWTVCLAVPWAVSAVVALAAKNLDG